MKKRLFIILLISLPVLLAAAPALVPNVKEYNSDGEKFNFNKNGIFIEYDDVETGLDFENTAKTTGADLFEKTNIPVNIGSTAEANSLVISLSPALTRKIDPEAYEMEISEKGIQIKAWDATGLFWGTRTAIQLISQGLQDEEIVLEKARIYDRPEFKNRGLLLDCGRKYFSPETIKFLLKHMADYKMNYFHWHLTEWNGFRFDSEVFPGLGTKDASYSIAQIKDILAYAEKYHILVVPELDIPGHANALIEYDPKLNFQKGKFRSYYWAFNGKITDKWHINPTSDYTRNFIKELITEMCEVFPGPYFHIGTDEYIHNPFQMAMNKDFRDYKKAKGFKEYPDIWIDFINYCNSIVKDNGKITKMWNWWEVSFSWMKTRYSIEVDRDVEYDVWLGESAEKLGEFGVNMINCSGSATYITPGVGVWPSLDYLYGQWTPYEFEVGKVISDKYKNQVQGSKINLWADDAEEQPEDYFVDKLYLPLVALGSVCWQGQGGDVEEFLQAFEVVDK